MNDKLAREPEEKGGAVSTNTGSLAFAMRAARRERGLTQGQLAGRLGVSQTTISFWERGLDGPRVERLIALANELPRIVESLPDRERDLLRRLLRIERQVFAGRCACPGCTCQTQAARGSPPTDAEAQI